jgi:hypothetical protein
MVEAAGVEPASEKTQQEESTCVSDSFFVSLHNIKNQQDCCEASPVGLTGNSQATAAGQPISRRSTSAAQASAEGTAA